MRIKAERARRALPVTHRWLAALLAAGIGWAAAPAAPAPARASGPAPGVVTAIDPATGRPGPGLWAGGQPWRAVGFDVFDSGVLLMPRYTVDDPAPCFGQHANLDTYLDTTLGEISRDTAATAIRLPWGVFWDQSTNAGTDWSSTDKWLYYARKYNIRLIPTFGNPYHFCGAPNMTESWFHCPAGTGPASGSATPCIAPGASCPSGDSCWVPGYADPAQSVTGVDFRTYLSRVATHYAGRPEIAFWQLVNEADATGVSTAALLDFLTDMTGVIQGAENAVVSGGAHLVNLGTISGNLPGSTGIDEAHDWPESGTVDGYPLVTGVTPALALTSAQGKSATVSATAPLPADTWSQLAFAVPAPPVGDAWTGWCLTLSAGASPWTGGYTAGLDQVSMQDAGGTHAYSFEDGGLDGFTAGPGTALRNTGDTSADGIRSLAADTTSRTPAICGPQAAGLATGSSVTLSARTTFSAPAPSTARNIATYVHNATEMYGRPIFSGEVGRSAQVTGANPIVACPSRTLDERAALFASMLSNQLGGDPDASSPYRFHGSSGFLVWDWKDPSLQSTDPESGQLTSDPEVSCFSVTPGDPTESTVRSWVPATRDTLTGYAPPAWFPADGSAPPGDQLLQVFPVRHTAVVGATFRVEGRLTSGGSAIQAATIALGSPCPASVRTDFSGVFTAQCTASRAGAQSVTVAYGQSALSVPFTAKHALILSGSAAVVTRGASVPVNITLRYADGAAIAATDALSYSVSGCGGPSAAPAGSTSVTVAFTCPANPSAGATTLTLAVPESDTVLPGSSTFRSLAFDHIYADSQARGCVGLVYDSSGNPVRAGWSEYAQDDPAWTGAGPAGDPERCTENTPAFAWFFSSDPSGMTGAGHPLGAAVTDYADPGSCHQMTGTFAEPAGSSTFVARLTRRDCSTYTLSST
ncbi:MAG: hypothetical protein ACYDAY_03385 [Candidatus Dormibacteria bacterium]